MDPGLRSVQDASDVRNVIQWPVGFVVYTMMGKGHNEPKNVRVSLSIWNAKNDVGLSIDPTVDLM